MKTVIYICLFAAAAFIALKLVAVISSLVLAAVLPLVALAGGYGAGHLKGREAERKKLTAKTGDPGLPTGF